MNQNSARLLGDFYIHIVTSLGCDKCILLVRKRQFFLTSYMSDVNLCLVYFFRVKIRINSA